MSSVIQLNKNVSLIVPEKHRIIARLGYFIRRNQHESRRSNKALWRRKEKRFQDQPDACGFLPTPPSNSPALAGCPQSDNYIPCDSIASNRSGLSPTRLPPTSDASCKYTMLPALLMKLLKSFPPMPFLLLLSRFSCV